MKSLRVIILIAATVGLAGCAGRAVLQPSMSGAAAVPTVMPGSSTPALRVAFARAVPQSVASSPHQVQLAATTQSSTFVATTAGAKVQASIDRIRHSQDGSRVAGFSAGAYQGKNVIIIQVESLDGLLIDKKYDGREITPNLNKLLKQSWYWPNAYSETGMGNTADAEFIVNTSLYAPRDQAAVVKYTPRTIPGLPRVLRRLSYYTFTIHQNKVQYWNRRQMYKGLGFNRYYDYDFFHGAPKMGPFGASDEELFKRVVPVMRTLDASSTPFYSHIITLSAHGPFDGIPESRRPLRTPKELSGSLMGEYISAESYSDYAIGKFIKSLQATNLWNDSIIVIYGDHTAMPSNTLTGKNALGARKLLGRAYGPIDRQRIPLIVHLPGQTTPVVRADAAGQVDIMPTVADLVGADLSQVPHLGRSLFVASGPLVALNAYLPGGSVLNGRVLFMPGRGSRKAASAKLPNGSATNPSATDSADGRRAASLWKISESWLLSLPKFNGGVKGWIPDAVARAAAKPYGFLQKGTGSK